MTNLTDKALRERAEALDWSDRCTGLPNCGPCRAAYEALRAVRDGAARAAREEALEMAESVVEAARRDYSMHPLSEMVPASMYKAEAAHAIWNKIRALKGDSTNPHM